MPTVSKRQRNAMMAAAHGKSKLGIPRKVGREFVRADKVPPLRKQHDAEMRKRMQFVMGLSKPK